MLNAVHDSGLYRDMCPPDYCLPLHYSKGTTFSSHFDSRYRWGETVMGINLGAPSVIQFIPQSKDGGTGVTQNIYLPRRCIYIMSGPSRVGWKHGICKISKVHHIFLLSRVKHFPLFIVISYIQFLLSRMIYYLSYLGKRRQ